MAKLLEEIGTAVKPEYRAAGRITWQEWLAVAAILGAPIVVLVLVIWRWLH